MGRYAAAIAVVLMMSTSPLFAQNTQFVVTTTSADVHRAPSTGSTVIGKAPRGQSLEVRRELGSWVSVSWPEADNGVGYLHVAWGRIAQNPSSQPQQVTQAEPPAAQPSQSAADPATASQVDLTPGSTPSPRTISRSAPSLPSHVIGLGGRMGTPSVGFAAAARAWTHGRLGVQIEAGQSTHTSAVTLEQLRSTQLAPSVIYSLPNTVTNAIWARPYVGAGVSMHRFALRNNFGGPAVTDTGVGAQILGGAEFTWAALPQFSLSADMRHQWAPETFFGFELGGTGLSLSAHWYVK